MNPPHENLPPTPSRFSRWWPRILGILLVVFLAIQLIEVDGMDNPPSDVAFEEPPEVVAILKRSCYDCHSNEVRWPWYSRVAPASWLIAQDVVEGRESINFSEWPEHPEDQAFNRQQVWDSVDAGDMPLWFYLPLHPEARLSDADKKILQEWAETELPDEEDEDGEEAASNDAGVAVSQDAAAAK